MMDWKAALRETKSLRDEQYDLQERQRELRKREMKIKREVSNYWGEKYTGFKVGDIIEWQETSWKEKTKTVKMVITYFDGYVRDEEIEDDNPSIHGVRILKNGERGTQTDSVYFHQKRNPRKIGEMALPRIDAE